MKLKIFLSAVAMLSVVIAMPVIAAKKPGTDKTGLSEPLKACYKECDQTHNKKRKKDDQAYESCMIECKKVDNARSASATK